MIDKKEANRFLKRLDSFISNQQQRRQRQLLTFDQLAQSWDEAYARAVCKLPDPNKYKANTVFINETAKPKGDQITFKFEKDTRKKIHYWKDISC
jgi:hypothetical protein